MKEQLKSKKGITLIALVITIVILIILAGISIAILTGEDGLISKAKEAGRKQKIAEIKEKIGLELMVAETDAILRGEQLELAQRDDIASKYGTVNGDILTTEKDNYEIDLKEIYNKTLSESGSYTAQKQLIATLQNELATSESNLAIAQMSQSEAAQELSDLRSTLATATATPDDVLSSKTIYDKTDGTVKNGTITVQTATSVATIAGTGEQTLTLNAPGYYDKVIIDQTNAYDEGLANGTTTHTTTYTFPENSTGDTYELGINHNYRYVNATNVYNKGKADGGTAQKSGTLAVSVTYYREGWEGRGASATASFNGYSTSCSAGFQNPTYNSSDSGSNSTTAYI